MHCGTTCNRKLMGQHGQAGRPEAQLFQTNQASSTGVGRAQDSQEPAGRCQRGPCNRAGWLCRGCSSDSQVGMPDLANA